MLQNEVPLKTETGAPAALTDAKRPLEHGDVSLLDRITPGDVIDGKLVNNLTLEEWEKVFKKTRKASQFKCRSAERH